MYIMCACVYNVCVSIECISNVYVCAFMVALCYVVKWLLLHDGETFKEGGRRDDEERKGGSDGMMRKKNKKCSGLGEEGAKTQRT